MVPPHYASDEASLGVLAGQAKRWTCPHCRSHGTVNGHGYLRGAAEDGRDKQAVRGRRFFCSNRGHRRGCGHTFSVVLRQVIAGASVRSGELWRFCQTRLTGASVLAAWETLRSRFSVEAAYGWWRRWRRGLPVLRTLFLRGREPPDAELGQVLVARYGAADPIGEFQWREQRGWP